MDANYLYLPLSVEAITGLESALSKRDTDKSVLFKGCREIVEGLEKAEGNGRLSDDSHVIAIQLKSDLSIEELADLIEDHSRSAQQADILKTSDVQMLTGANGEKYPKGTGELILAGTIEDDSIYFSLTVNCDMARRYCRAGLLPEIIYDPEEAMERFLSLRREMELYLSYGVRRFVDVRDSYYDLPQDKLMKAVRLIEIVTEERFPKFRDCLFEPGFRNDFMELFLEHLESSHDEDSGESGKKLANELFVLFALIRGLVGTEEWLEKLPGKISPDLKSFIARMISS